MKTKYTVDYRPLNSIFDGDKTTLVDMQETVIHIDTNTNMATYIKREYIFEKALEDKHS